MGAVPTEEVVAYARGQRLLSSAHFSVDGTLSEANASRKHFKRKDQEDDRPAAPPDDPGNPSGDCHGQKRSNATHQSRTDPDARLKKQGKGKEAKLVFEGHALMENRNGLRMELFITPASGTAERDAVPKLLGGVIERGLRPCTLGADKGYDIQDCVADLHARGHWPCPDHLSPPTTASASPASHAFRWCCPLFHQPVSTTSLVGLNPCLAEH